MYNVQCPKDREELERTVTAFVSALTYLKRPRKSAPNQLHRSKNLREWPGALSEELPMENFIPLPLSDSIFIFVFRAVPFQK